MFYVKREQEEKKSTGVFDIGMNRFADFDAHENRNPHPISGPSSSGTE